jgi:hypothetical protein
MSDNLNTITIFKESNYMESTSYREDAAIDSGAEYVSFAEDGTEKNKESATLGDMLESFTEGEDSFGEIGSELEDLDKDVTKFIEEHGDMEVGDLLPGAEVRLSDLNEEDDERETDYANDRDLSKFMGHVSDLYPSQIPQHDGTSTVGCERAISFLDRLNGDISKAIREDQENVLDIAKLEDVRVNIMRDVLVLKDHLSKLKKQIKDSHGQKSSTAAAPSVPNWKNASGQEVPFDKLKETGELEKKAATPRNLVIAVSPFERAISGMMINAHISAGHPMEEVYGSLKKKYGLTDREELSIMQLCMDSGFPIFKDRGSYSEEASDDEEKRGIDFVRNYFS